MMVLLTTPICDFDMQMPSFELQNIDDSFVKSSNIKGLNGTLVMFICNHCPYVKAVIEKIVETTNKLDNLGISSVAIMPNDTLNYPEDSFDNMKIFAQKHQFKFPYLIDSTQKISKEFGAVCTPDFFGFNSNNKLNYRGRIGEMENLKFVGKRNELLDAMTEISKKNLGPSNQYVSAGCSIKWKTS